MPNDPTFDLTKHYIHMEDNEDGTITFTISGFLMPDGSDPVTIIVEGELDDFLLNASFNISPEDVADFKKRSVVIPNGIAGGDGL